MLFSMNKDSFTSCFSVYVLFLAVIPHCTECKHQDNTDYNQQKQMTSLAVIGGGGGWVFSLPPLDMPFSVEVLLMTFIRLSSTLFSVF